MNRPETRKPQARIKDLGLPSTRCSQTLSGMLRALGGSSVSKQTGPTGRCPPRNCKRRGGPRAHRAGSSCRRGPTRTPG
eukprot:6272843-Alexandrium_andersonii.AAC.1